jgi:FkbM family methyltransferase
VIIKYLISNKRLRTKYINLNIQINGFSQIKPILGALADGNDILNIHIPAYWNMGSTQISNSQEGLDGFLCASFNIKDLIKKYQLKGIDLVKLDVEGQEINIISSFFKNGIYPAYIMFEFIPEAFEGATEVIALLMANNYEIRDIVGASYAGTKSVLEQNLIAKKV